MNKRVCGSEGHTVIAADVGGQAALFKKPLKHSESVLFPGRRKGFTGEQKPAGVIGDGQRIAVLVIAQQELAFVIGAPQLIGSLASDESGVPCARRRTRPRRSTRPWRSSTAWMVLLAGMGIPENRRSKRSRILRAPQLGCSCFTFRDVVLDLKRKLVGIAIRTPASVGEPLNAAFLITIEDLVAGLAGNAKLPAKFRHRLAG